MSSSPRLLAVLIACAAMPAYASTLNLSLPARAVREPGAEVPPPPATVQALPKSWDGAYRRCEDSSGNCVIKSTLRLSEFFLDTAMEPVRRKVRCPMFNPADDCNRLR